jgi:hypothetical protein
MNPIKLVVILTLVTLTACSGIRPNRRLAASNSEIQTFMDGQLSSMRFNPFVQGNVNADILMGQAKAQFELWQKLGNPAVTSLSDNGTALWVVSVVLSQSEFGGGTQTTLIAVFLASDGSLQASGNLPSSNGIKGFAWDSDPKVTTPAVPKAFQPEMKVAASSQNGTFVIKRILGEFDEVALANKTYNGSDPSGNPLKMKAVKGASNLSFTIFKGSAQMDSFAIDSSTQINETNFDQYNSDTEGSYFVVSTGPKNAEIIFWIHNFEGNTVIKIQRGDKTTEFDFDSDN